jgi:hypothetical protein
MKATIERTAPVTGLIEAMIDGRNCPWFVCEHCRRSIDDATMATVLWESVDGDRGNGPLVFVRALCTRAFDRARPGAFFLSEDLDRFLACLVHNAGLRGSKWRDAVKRAREECGQRDE